MKFRRLKIVLVLVLFPLFTINSVNAQSVRDKQIANYIFDFGFHLRWINDDDIDLIKIGVLNGSSSFLNELRKATKGGYGGIILVEVVDFKSIAEIKETHMLFVPKKMNSQFENVKKRIKGYNTALISEEYSPKKSIIINFVKKGSNYTFELNAENLNSYKVRYDEKISELGGIIISTKELYDESEKNLKIEKRRVKEQQSKLDEQKKLIEKQNDDIAKKKKELEAQKNKLLSQADDIADQEKKLKKQRAELLVIEERAKKAAIELDKKDADIKDKEKAIKDKEDEIRNQTNILAEQENIISERQKKIGEMDNVINAQQGTLIIYKNYMLIGAGVLLIFLVMLFFILRGYRIKKRDNKKLAQQKKEIEEKTHELEATNIELEKLSIVASETSNAVIILDTLGRFEWVNVGFTKMYGHTLDALKSNVGEDIYRASNHPGIENLVKECINEKKTVIYESFVNTDEEKGKWAQTTLTPIVSGDEVIKLVLIDSDISKIKEAEDEIIRKSDQIASQAKELEKQNVELEKLSLVASKTDNSVIIANVDGEIEWVNDGFTRLLGQSFEDFSSEYGTNMFKSSLNKRLREQLQIAIKERRSIIYSSKTSTKDGRKIWIQTTMTPIFDATGTLSKYIAIDADITKIKLAEEEITRQKQKITDSIIYAQKIQTAVLPPDDYLKNLLNEYFIMFRPKDIVSGDFYWATQKGDKVMVAAVDCTGHGVPGGFMSMLGITFLNAIAGGMDEEEITAGEILNQLRENVKISLRQTGKEGEAKDGMDIALCVIDKKTNILQFSGANNPLLIVREHNNNEIELINVKADDMPIGIYFGEKSSFANHKIQLQKGDLCYIFSDGFPDQFGGKNGRKFMLKRFKSMLAMHSDKPMAEQKEIVGKAFDKWKGEHRQIDDVLVIGVKI